MFKTKCAFGYEHRQPSEREAYLIVESPHGVDRITVIAHRYLDDDGCPRPSDYSLLEAGKNFVVRFGLNESIYLNIKPGIYQITAVYEHYWEYPDTTSPIRTWKGKIRSNTITLHINDSP